MDKQEMGNILRKIFVLMKEQVKINFGVGAVLCHNETVS
jgi:hypothetical protein